MMSAQSWDEGYNAYLRGELRENNPSKSLENRCHWFHGWDDAEDFWTESDELWEETL